MNALKNRISRLSFAIALTSSIGLLAGCGDNSAEAEAGDGSPSIANEAPGDNKFWDPQRMKAAMDADTGEKSLFICTVLITDMYNSSGIAEAIRSLGVEKRSDAEMSLMASSVDAARKILQDSANNVGDHISSVDVRRCVREYAASDVKYLDRPESDYQEIDALKSIYLYYAVSGEKPPYDKIAGQWSGYSVIRDDFAKRDRLAEISSEINLGIDRAKSNHFVWIEFQSAIPKFDFDKGVYPLQEVLGARTYITPSDGRGNVGYRLMFNQRDAFAAYTPANEEQAREIEAGVSEGMRQHLVRVYGKVEAAEQRDGRETLLVTPTRVVVEQPKRWDIRNPRKLFEIVAK